MYMEMTYLVSSRAGPWACFELFSCSAVQGPFSFFPHALLIETKTSVQEQLEECRDLGKEVFSHTGFPIKTAGTISIMLLALDIVDIDGCIRYCITGLCSLKSNVFLLQTKVF